MRVDRTVHTRYKSRDLEITSISNTHEDKLAIVAARLHVGDACNRDALYSSSQIGHKLPTRHVSDTAVVAPSLEQVAAARTYVADVVVAVVEAPWLSSVGKQVALQSKLGERRRDLVQNGRLRQGHRLEPVPLSE